MLGKIHLFLTHSKTESSQPSSCTYNLQPNLLGRMSRITGQFGCCHRAKFIPSVGGGLGRKMGVAEGRKFTTCEGGGEEMSDK